MKLIFTVTGALMTLRKTILSICILLMLPLSAPASEKPDIYTIKKGIPSGVFQIDSSKILIIGRISGQTTPQSRTLISSTPGRSSPSTMAESKSLRLSLRPAIATFGRSFVSGEEPDIITTAAVETAQEMPQEEIQIFDISSGIGFVNVGDIENSGRIVDAVDNRLVLGPSDTVFLELNDLDGAIAGTRYTLLEIAEKIKHPITQRDIGYKVIDLGQLEISQVHDEVASGLILSSNREIFRGAILVPYQETDKEITLKKQERDLSGYLIATLRGNGSIGQFDIVYSDIGGAADGLEKGNMVRISRPRSGSISSLTKLKLPDVLVGEGVIVGVRDSTATILVLKSADSIFIGDRISTITN